MLHGLRSAFTEGITPKAFALPICTFVWVRYVMSAIASGLFFEAAARPQPPSYCSVPLPAGPAGKGTLQYDGGWGLAAASKNKSDAMAAISYLTATKVEMGNAKAFGVMPSVRADAKEWSKLYPQFAAFLAGADYSKSIPTVPDIGTVLGDFNQQLQALPQSDPKPILNRVNGELQAILK